MQFAIELCTWLVPPKYGGARDRSAQNMVVQGTGRFSGTKIWWCRGQITAEIWWCRGQITAEIWWCRGQISSKEQNMVVQGTDHRRNMVVQGTGPNSKVNNSHSLQHFLRLSL